MAFRSMKRPPRAGGGRRSVAVTSSVCDDEGDVKEKRRMASVWAYVTKNARGDTKEKSFGGTT